ncbi:MAG: carboxypeptidase-like regulatory domain-containing protein [Candidatus Hodarchaeales archaeon]
MNKNINFAKKRLPLVSCLSVLIIGIFLVQPTTIKVDDGIHIPPPVEVENKLLSIEEPNQPLTGIIPDPTGKTSGYSLEVQENSYFELLGSRGQTSRHFYNSESGSYTYQSDSLVQKVGLVEGTPWVTFDEFPNEFLIQLRNGTRRFFETPEATEDYLSSLDLSELSIAALETFSGTMGFNVDLVDTNGHNQYLYWPRLSNGTLPDYEMPLLEIYTHLYTKQSGQWTDIILNDRGLFPTNIDPRTTLDFFVSNSQIGIRFETPTLNLQGATWNVRHGFKFDLTDQLFHMITEFECLTADFTDIGLTYDILTSPQAKETPYELTNFLITNTNKTISVGKDETWQADSLLEEYDSNVELITQNGESISFVFDDMALAGFSEKYLNFQEVLLPSGGAQGVLRAGMYGFGVYTRDTWIEIDPTFECSTDDWDLWQDNTVYQTGNNYLKIGEIDLGRRPFEHDYHTYRAWLAFDTEITTFINISGTDAVLELHVSSTSMESPEGASAYLYNIGNNFDNSSCKESSTSWSYGTYKYQSNLLSLSSTGWQTSYAGKMYNLLDYWAKNRQYDENYISLSLIDYWADKEQGTGDVATISESTSTNDPQLTFNYTINPIQLSGYVIDNSTSLGIDWASVEAFNSDIQINKTHSDNTGYYLLTVNAPVSYDLWIWHQDYKNTTTTIIANASQTINFTLQPESVPSINPPYGCKDPTASYDPYYSWKNDHYAYSNDSYYAVGESNNIINYQTYQWAVPASVTVQGVYVFIHWKPALDDNISVKLHWNGGSSDTVSLDTSDWDLVVLNFTDATSWTPTKVNNNFYVDVQKVTENYADEVIVDWVGTLVEYADVRAKSCSFSAGSKGSDRYFDLLFHNYGTITADNFDYRLKINSSDYTDYETWINKTYEGTSVTAGSDEMEMPFIPSIFEGTTDYQSTTWDGWFALNVGDFNIIDVYIFGDDWGYDFSQPSSSTFDITNSASTHKIFVAAIACDDISTPIDLFNELETHDLYVENATQTGWDTTDFSTYFSTEFILTVIESGSDTSVIANLGGPDSTNTSELSGFTVNEGSTKLGLSVDWQNGDGWDPSGRGTYSSNHGFDLLAVFVNTTSMGGVGLGWQNTMAFNYEGIQWITTEVVLHELCHTYMNSGTTIEHNKYSPIADYYGGPYNDSYDLYGIGSFVMGGPEDEPKWHMHPDTETRVADRIDHYDGLS